MLFPLFLTIKHRRDFYYRQNAANYEIKARIEQATKRNRGFNLKKRPYCHLYLMRSARIKNICIWSGRARGISYKGFSRFAIKFFATRGRWLGLRKASW
jgi:ribosomal protein S14